MWLIPFTPGSTHFLEVHLPVAVPLAGLRVYNYNKGVHSGGAWEEDPLRGARRITVFVDDNRAGNKQPVSFVPLGEYMLRLAPGCDGVDYGQTVLFRNVRCPSIGNCPAVAHRTAVGSKQGQLQSYASPVVKQDYETPLNPSGLLWRFVLHENWNDGFYIGLDRY